MGSISHYVLAVTGRERDVRAAHAFASTLYSLDDNEDRESGCRLSPVLEHRVNGVCSFFVTSDGSKYSNESQHAAMLAKLRRELRAWRADEHAFDAGWGLDFAQVGYGLDHGPARVYVDSESDDP